MSLVYDLCQPGNSWLHRRDPRVKLLYGALWVVALLLADSLFLVLFALFLSHVLLISARITWRRLVGVWRLSGPTMLMVVAFWALLYPGSGPYLVDWWIVRISGAGLLEGLRISLRIGALAFVLSVPLSTTNQTAVARGLVALGLPHTWGLTLAMSLRYLPTMANAFTMISQAQQARGLDLDARVDGANLVHRWRGLVRRARAYVPIAVAMLISTLRAAQNISYTLDSRALGASPRPTSLHPLRMEVTDWYAVGVLGAGVVALVVGEWCLR